MARFTSRLVVVLALAACGPGPMPPSDPTQPPAPETATPPLASWLQSSAVPLDEAGIAATARALSGPRVLGLGEATHGTEEFFALKAALFRVLARDHGVRTLAMELEPEAAARIDAVLQGGAGDLTTLTRGSYFFLEADAIVELLEWMRTHNAGAATEDRLHFVGIDLDPEQRGIVDARCGDRSGCRTVLRDMAMAENVQAIGGRAVLWAHNGHVAHFEADDGWRPLGQVLREALGHDYLAVGFEFGQGRFVAPAGGELPVVRTFETSTGRPMAEYELPPPPQDALAATLDQRPEPAWFVLLSTVPKPAWSLFERNRNLHSYGAVPPAKARHYERYPPLPEIFDALVFVRETQGYRMARGSDRDDLVPCSHPTGPSFEALRGWDLVVFGPDRVKLRLIGADARGGFDYAVVWVGLPDQDGRNAAQVITDLNGPDPAVVTTVDDWVCTAPTTAAPWDPELADRRRGTPTPTLTERPRPHGAAYYSCAGPSVDGVTLLVSGSLTTDEWHRLGGAAFLVRLGKAATGFSRARVDLRPSEFDCFDPATMAIGG